MFDPLKWLAKLIPYDKNNIAGIGPFRLPDRCAWMEPVFRYHDYYYEIGPENNMALSDIDWRIFKALVQAAEQADTTLARCTRAHDICKYWPIMRDAGHYLYARHYQA